MAAFQTSPDTEARRETHRKFHNLCDIKAQAERLRTATLDDEQLQSLHIQRLGDLDVDETGSCDFSPRFFVPLPSDKLPDLPQGDEDDWRTPCSDSKKSDGWCNAFWEARFRAEWVYRILQYNEAWHTVCMDGRNELPFFEGYLRENNPERLDNSECQVFQARYASIFHDDSVPHMICDVADTTVAGPETLRSEIVTGITLIKRQLRSLRFADHHIIPVLIVSFQHDCAARITQAHFDGSRIFIRQSRRLDLSADRPTDDAYLILRWMTGRPTGDTTLAACVCVEEAATNQDLRLQPNNVIAVDA